MSILKVLLALALRGRLRGLAICYRTEDCEEHTAFTGAYKTHGTAAAASLRMSVALMQANGELE